MHRVRPVLSLLTSLIGAAPPASLPHVLDLAVAFILIGTLSSRYRVFICKEQKGGSWVMTLLTSFLQFLLLLILATAVSAMTGRWVEVEAAAWVIVSIESLSILKTIVALQYCGGVDMGPAKPMIERLANLLQKNGNPLPHGETNSDTNRTKSRGAMGEEREGRGDV